MITVEETYKESKEAYGWMIDDLHPTWDREQGIAFMSNYFPSINARMFAFYEDGKHVASIATVEGMNLHHGRVIDLFSVVSPDARGHRSLLKEMLEHSKQVCREAGVQCFVRSVHVSPTIDKIKYTYIGGE